MYSGEEGVDVDMGEPEKPLDPEALAERKK